MTTLNRLTPPNGCRPRNQVLVSPGVGRERRRLAKLDELAAAGHDLVLATMARKPLPDATPREQVQDMLDAFAVLRRRLPLRACLGGAFALQVHTHRGERLVPVLAFVAVLPLGACWSEFWRELAAADPRMANVFVRREVCRQFGTASIGGYFTRPPQDPWGIRREDFAAVERAVRSQRCRGVWGALHSALPKRAASGPIYQVVYLGKPGQERGPVDRAAVLGEQEERPAAPGGADQGEARQVVTTGEPGIERNAEVVALQR